MHEAYIKIDKADKVLTFRAKGHAGETVAGENITCAAASILTMTLAETMQAAYNAGWVGDDIVVNLADAFNAEISCVCDDEEVFGELARAYLLIATGYRLLAEHYPDAVKFNAEIRA